MLMFRDALGERPARIDGVTHVFVYLLKSFVLIY